MTAPGDKEIFPWLRRVYEQIDAFPLLVVPSNQTELKPHKHDFVEIVSVAKGEGIHLHEGRQYPVHVGDCYVILPGDLHGYGATRDLRLYNLIFAFDLLAPYLPDLRQVQGLTDFLIIEPLHRKETAFRNKLHVNGPAQSTIERIIASIDAELTSAHPGYKTVATCRFVELLVILGRCLQEQMPAQLPNQGNGLVDKTMAYLERNFANEISFKAMALELAVSHSHLSRSFRKATHLSMHDYLIKIRLDWAAKMLAEKDLNITGIAFACGFEDPGYFARLFRKRLGCSPSDYRMRFR